MMIPRVFICGDVRTSGAGTCYKNALQELGVSVEHVSDWIRLESYYGQSAKRLWYRLMHRVLPSDLKRHERTIEDAVHAFHPHLILTLKGLHWRSEFVRSLRRTGACVINLNHDDFFSKYRSTTSRKQRRAISSYDRILTTRPVNVPEIQPINPNVEFFPFSYSPELHRPVTPTAEQSSRLSSDCLFVGTYARHRAEMMEQLVQRVPAKYAIHGGGWSRLSSTSPLRRYVMSDGLYLDDMAAAIGMAKMSLGFLRKENRDEYTQRSFEIPACGGVLLAERTKIHNQLYREGVEAEFFDANSIEELCAKVQHLMENAQYRESMRRAGLQAVQAGGYTYADRARRLIEIYQAWHTEGNRSQDHVRQSLDKHAEAKPC